MRFREVGRSMEHIETNVDDIENELYTVESVTEIIKEAITESVLETVEEQREELQITMTDEEIAECVSEIVDNSLASMKKGIKKIVDQENQIIMLKREFEEKMKKRKSVFPDFFKDLA